MAYEVLPAFFAAALGFMKLEPPTGAVVELGEQGQIVESRTDLEKLAFWLMKRKDAACSS